MSNTDATTRIPSTRYLAPAGSPSRCWANPALACTDPFLAEDALDAVQSRFMDTYTVRRPGEPMTDPETGEVTNGGVDVYTGKGKLQVNASAETPEAGGHQFTV